ncbi:hypothetical protein [Chitinophaga tropicalis]|nr:hypothetical protein [Chitinophaga tropicalis]
MILQDFILLARKIILGIIIFLVPLILIAGALWLVQNILLT